MDCVSVWVQSRFYINLVKTYLSSYKKMISFALTLCLTINGFACKLVIVFFIIVIHKAWFPFLPGMPQGVAMNLTYLDSKLSRVLDISLLHRYSQSFPLLVLS